MRLYTVRFETQPVERAEQSKPFSLGTSIQATHRHTAIYMTYIIPSKVMEMYRSMHTHIYIYTHYNI